MRISRRKFAQGTLLTGFAVARGGDLVTLRAISAAQMPSSIQLPASLLKSAKARGARVFEQRIYGAPVPAALFERAGVVPLTVSSGEYLIPFRSLEERQKIWDGCSSDPIWQSAQDGLRILEISLYVS